MCYTGFDLEHRIWLVILLIPWRACGHSAYSPREPFHIQGFSRVSVLSRVKHLFPALICIWTNDFRSTGGGRLFPSLYFSTIFCVCIYFRSLSLGAGVELELQLMTTSDNCDHLPSFGQTLWTGMVTNCFLFEIMLLIRNTITFISSYNTFLYKIEFRNKRYIYMAMLI